jgi:hypothetical protein
MIQADFHFLNYLSLRTNVLRGVNVGSCNIINLSNIFLVLILIRHRGGRFTLIRIELDCRLTDSDPIGWG